MAPAEGDTCHELSTKDGARDRCNLGVRARGMAELPVVRAAPGVHDPTRRDGRAKVLAARGRPELRQVLGLGHQPWVLEVGVGDTTGGPGARRVAVAELPLARAAPAVEEAVHRDGEAVVAPSGGVDHGGLAASHTCGRPHMRLRRLSKGGGALAARLPELAAAACAPRVEVAGLRDGKRVEEPGANRLERGSRTQDRRARARAKLAVGVTPEAQYVVARVGHCVCGSTVYALRQVW